MPNSIIEANRDGVFVYGLVVVVAEQLDGVGSGPSSVGCLVCDTGVQSGFEYLLFC